MSPNDRQLIELVFAGDGEMATRMRELDWSMTALGPVEQWPQALRTCVRLMLGSNYTMTIMWGPDLAYLYNDANVPVVETKHPWALGRRCREVYPEAWDFVGPLFDRVMTKGEASGTLADQLFVMHRKDYLEECYFAFSFSPVPDDSGRAGGVLTIVLETTERVLEDRRRHLLSDLASRAAGARTEKDVWHVSVETLGEN